MKIREAIPPTWVNVLGEGRLGLGLDLASSTKDTSNPSALVVTEKQGGSFIERLVLRWKTANPAVTSAIVHMVVGDALRAGKRIRRGVVDASNERLFAKGLKSSLLGKLPLELMMGGQTLKWQGQEYKAKVLLGLLYVRNFEENQIATPEAKWLGDDRGLVKRNGENFDAEIGDGGAHGDTFDAGKLANWALIGAGGGGPVHAAAAALGEMGGRVLSLLDPLQRDGRRPMFAHLHDSRD